MNPNIEPHRIRNFYKHFSQSEDCWEWTACRDRDGYGIFNMGELGENFRANRASWIIHNGPIPKRMMVLHKCDNRPCVNPKHLFLGTNDENMKDMVNKGRAARGVKNVNSKITEHHAFMIKHLSLAGNRICDIMKQLSLPRKTVEHVVYGNTWKHVPWPKAKS